jgi:hypothetical protein
MADFTNKIGTRLGKNVAYLEKSTQDGKNVASFSPEIK